MMGLDNPIHLAFLAMLLLLVFGAKRLPEIGRSLGAGMRGFRESISGETATPYQLTSASEHPQEGTASGHPQEGTASGHPQEGTASHHPREGTPSERARDSDQTT